jgi:hypothetical protein
MWRTLPLLVFAAACHEVPIAPATPSAWRVTGDGQTGVPGFRLANPIVLHLSDTDGRVIAGDTIDFTPSDPFARVEPRSIGVTDTNGNVSVYWRLGGLIGPQTLAARSRIPGAGTSTITADARSNQLQSLDGGDAGLCGVTTAGVLGCWLPGRLGVTDLTPHLKPVSASLQFTQVAMLGTALPNPGVYGGASACALTVAGRVWCFHLDSMANASNGGELAGNYPPLTQLVSGGYAGTTFCALTVTGQAWCWGSDNTFGQLGDGTQLPHATPAPVATDARFVQLDIGGNTVCGVSTAGQAWCWGDNSEQIAGGPASAITLPTPTSLAAPASFSSVRVLPFAGLTCGFVGAPPPMCWGDLAALAPGASSAATPTALAIQPSPADLMENYDVNDGVDGGAGVFMLDRGGSLRRIFPGRALVPGSGLLQDVMLAHGAGYICGLGSSGNATLCLSESFRFGDLEPSGGYLIRPAVVGVPFQ